MTLLNILLQRRGKLSAITSQTLASQTGVNNERQVRLQIRELIARGVPVASSTQPPYGYYIPSTKDEAEEYLRSLRSRLIEDALRRRDFKKAFLKCQHPNQQLCFWR